MNTIWVTVPQLPPVTAYLEARASKKSCIDYSLHKVPFVVTLLTPLIFCSFQTVKFILHSINMSAIGSLIFCTDCGNLLRESTGNANAILHCDVCGTRNKGR